MVDLPTPAGPKYRVLAGAQGAVTPKNFSSRHEVTVGHAAQVDQRQHLGDFGLLRHHDGTIELGNRTRSPISSSTRLSLTRCASISMGPVPVVIQRGSADQIRDHVAVGPRERRATAAGVVAARHAVPAHQPVHPFLVDQQPGPAELAVLRSAVPSPRAFGR
jgi:hypothetical protein